MSADTGKGIQKRLLIVEDDAEMRRLLMDEMAEEGYNVTPAADGSEAAGDGVAVDVAAARGGGEAGEPDGGEIGGAGCFFSCSTCSFHDSSTFFLIGVSLIMSSARAAVTEPLRHAISVLAPQPSRGVCGRTWVASRLRVIRGLRRSVAAGEAQT